MAANGSKKGKGQPKGPCKECPGKGPSRGLASLPSESLDPTGLARP